MIAHLNEALRELHEFAKTHGRDVAIYLNYDGRVSICFDDLAGWTKETVKADLLPGSALPLPAEALEAMGWVGSERSGA